MQGYSSYGNKKSLKTSCKFSIEIHRSYILTDEDKQRLNPLKH